MRHSKVIVAGVCVAIAILVGIWPRGGSGSISAAFTHYGRYQDFTNEPFAYFVVSNTGSRQVFCRGVADSSSRQFAQVASEQGWVDADPWISTGATFYLSPGESREVAVWVETDRAWRVAFRFRETGFVDRCPWFVWRVLPERMQRIPEFREVWSERVPAYARR
jgi:hypothetical protein